MFLWTFGFVRVACVLPFFVFYLIVAYGLGPVSAVCGAVVGCVLYSMKHFRYTIRQSMQYVTRQPCSSNENHPHWNSRVHKGADVTVGLERPVTHGEMVGDPISPSWNRRKPGVGDVVAGFGSLIAGLFLAVVAGVVAGVMFPENVGAVATFSQAFGTFAMGGILWAVLRSRGWKWGDLGLNPLGVKGWHLLWEIPVMFIVSFAVVAGVRAVVPVEDVPDTMGDVSSSGSAWILLALSVYVFVGPFVEEIIFRRLLMGWLDYKVGVVASTVLTCVIFALCHFNPASILWVGVMSVFVALSTRWHNSVWAGYVLHMVNNVLASLVLIVALF